MIRSVLKIAFTWFVVFITLVLCQGGYGNVDPRAFSTYGVDPNTFRSMDSGYNSMLDTSRSTLPIMGSQLPATFDASALTGSTIRSDLSGLSTIDASALLNLGSLRSNLGGVSGLNPTLAMQPTVSTSVRSLDSGMMQPAFFQRSMVGNNFGYGSSSMNGLGRSAAIATQSTYPMVRSMAPAAGAPNVRTIVVRQPPARRRTVRALDYDYDDYDDYDEDDYDYVVPDTRFVRARSFYSAANNSVNNTTLTRNKFNKGQGDNWKSYLTTDKNKNAKTGSNIDNSLRKRLLRYKFAKKSKKTKDKIQQGAAQRSTTTMNSKSDKTNHAAITKELLLLLRQKYPNLMKNKLKSQKRSGNLQFLQNRRHIGSKLNKVRNFVNKDSPTMGQRYESVTSRGSNNLLF